MEELITKEKNYQLMLVFNILRSHILDNVKKSSRRLTIKKGPVGVEPFGPGGVFSPYIEIRSKDDDSWLLLGKSFDRVVVKDNSTIYSIRTYRCKDYECIKGAMDIIDRSMSDAEVKAQAPVIDCDCCPALQFV